MVFGGVFTVQVSLVRADCKYLTPQTEHKVAARE
jgi:hypothetical protein